MKISFLVAACALAAAGPVLAVGTYSGTVNGYFDSELLSGNVVAIDGSLHFLDNTTTAFVVHTNLAPNNDTLTWGLSTTGANPSFSFLNFVGASFSNVAANTPFKLGTISYLNGTSDLNSLIFGATLHFDLGAGIDLKTSLISIVTTQNTGLGARRDADFIGFSDFSQTFNVFEGGFSVIELYGQIVGDPMVTLDSINIAPGFDNSGFIGNGVGGVPEPQTWAMLASGMFLTGGLIRRRRSLAPRLAA